MQLQKAKDTLKKQLAESKLTPDRTKSLENRLAKKTRQHADKWDEIINDPRKDEIINKIQQAQIKDLKKEERTRDQSREYDRTR